MSKEKTASEKLPTMWVVTELYYPEETSTGYYLTKIAESLTGKYQVRVVCGQPNYSKRGVRAANREIHKNVEIRRVFGATLDKNKIPNRIYNMLTLSISVFFQLLLNLKKSDKVLVVTTPPSLPVITALASLIRGANYILLIHDNYPEILIASGKLDEKSFFVKFAEFLNRWVYKYTSKIIVVGRDMRQMLLRKTDGLDIPVEIIPNWAELETVDPQPRNGNKLLKELGLENKFVLLYAGNMGYPNDLETIAAAAEKLLKLNNKVHFIFLGAGVKKKRLEREKEKKRLENITILEPRPRSQQTDFLNACDVALVSLVDKMKGVSMPSRTYNILAAGKPILAIADDQSELGLVVAEERIGWIVKPFDEAALTNIILRISVKSAELELMGKRARSAAETKYSEKIVLRAYQNL